MFHEGIIPLAKSTKSEEFVDVFTPLISSPQGIHFLSSIVSSPTQISPSNAYFILSYTITNFYIKNKEIFCTFTGYSVHFDIQYLIFSFLLYSQLSLFYLSFINAITKIPIPNSDLQDKASKEWCGAVDTEIRAMEATDTWDITSLPLGKKPVGCRWIFTMNFGRWKS